MLDAVRAEFGDDGVERMIQRREQATAKAYAVAVADADTLEARVARLAEIRTAEGYMASSSPDPAGGFLLVETHCPICAAAARRTDQGRSPPPNSPVARSDSWPDLGFCPLEQRAFFLRRRQAAVFACGMARNVLR